MGEAEDVIFARRKKANDDRDQAKDEYCEKLGAEIRKLVPQAIESLKHYNYPSAMHWFYTLTIDGKERAAWRILYAYESSDHVYLLGDGELAQRDKGRIQPEDVGRTQTFFDNRDGDRVIARLKEIINGEFD